MTDQDRYENDTVLDPGDTWTYTCSRVALAGDVSSVTNTATVTGIDKGGQQVSDTSQAKVTVNAPAQQVLAEQPVAKGSARLRGSVGCVTTRYAIASVSGSQISKVTFYVNGKKAKTLTKPNSGNRYTLRYRTRSLKVGSYRVRARVEFVAASQTSPRNLRLQFARCKPKIVRPKFTG